MTTQKFLKRLSGMLAVGGAAIIWSVGASAQMPMGIEGNVTVVNDDTNPVPVVIQGGEEANPVPVTVQDGSIEVSTAEPKFFRVSRVVFGDLLNNNNTDRVLVTERLLLHSITALTTTIRDTAGCSILVYTQEGDGPLTILFRISHFDKDATKDGDGQITQQQLGRGVVVEPGEEIVFQGNSFTHPDFPSPGPDLFCSSTVQVFGEVLPD